MDAITPSAVELKHVARRFITPTGEILSALEDFDLRIAPGEFFAIVGPTGCGKSTTLGLIAGLAKPQAGEVTQSSIGPCHRQRTQCVALALITNSVV